MTLLDLLARFADRSPDKLALRFHPDGETEAAEPGDWSYRRLFDAAAGAATGLSAHGVRAGDRVGVFLGNRPEMVTAYLGLLRLGAAMVPINLAYRSREIVHILDDAEPRLVLTDEENLHRLQDALASEEVGVEAVLTVEELASGGPSPTPTSFGRLGIEARPDSTALILYTSGTTGRSKGAVLSHANIRATVVSLLEAWEWSSNDRLLLTLPLFHTHGLVVGMHCALAAGATVELHRRFEAARVLDALCRPETTLFFGVPTMYVRLIEALRRRPTPVDLSHIRLFCSGSAPLDLETFAAFERLTGHAILERYGMTETGMLLSNPYRGPRRPGTVGRPLPGVEARVTGADGLELPAGAEGELLVRGDNVFSGYWRATEKTSESFVQDLDGRPWFRTGDLARCDPETRYYTLLGRRHELIISGGFNVYPREVEEVLTSLPGVREAAVVGHPHPEWGEEVVAFLVTEGPIEPDAIVAACKENLATFKVPRRIQRLDELPRNALGKVQKHLLPRTDSA